MQIMLVTAMIFVFDKFFRKNSRAIGIASNMTHSLFEKNSFWRLFSFDKTSRPSAGLDKHNNAI